MRVFFITPEANGVHEEPEITGFPIFDREITLENHPEKGCGCFRRRGSGCEWRSGRGRSRNGGGVRFASPYKQLFPARFRLLCRSCEIGAGMADYKCTRSFIRLFGPPRGWPVSGFLNKIFFVVLSHKTENPSVLPQPRDVGRGGARKLNGGVLGEAR